jgi:hypothetical protein
MVSTFTPRTANPNALDPTSTRTLHDNNAGPATSTKNPTAATPINTNLLAPMRLDTDLDAKTATTSAPSAAINAKIKIVSISTATTPVTKMTPTPKEVTGQDGQRRRE